MSTRSTLALPRLQGRREERSSPPPPPPPSSAPSAHADVCAGGGGLDTDAISAPFVPRAAGGYCLDPQSEPKTYGDKGKLTMDEVCTTAFDGECEVYKRFGLDRVVVLRYVDGTGAPNSVEVNLSRFATATARTPCSPSASWPTAIRRGATVKPLRPGPPAATSSSNAYVWRGQYLVELTFVTEDTKMTPAQMAQAERAGDGRDRPGHRRQAARLDGPPALGRAALPAALAHPARHRLLPEGRARPHGRRPGRRRATTRTATSAGATSPSSARTPRPQRRPSAPSSSRPGAIPVKGLGDEAVQVVIQEAPDRAKAEYIVARQGTTVAAVGDEELVLDPIDAERQAGAPQADEGREDPEARRLAQVRRHVAG